MEALKLLQTVVKICKREVFIRILLSRLTRALKTDGIKGIEIAAIGCNRHIITDNKILRDSERGCH